MMILITTLLPKIMETLIVLIMDMELEKEKRQRLWRLKISCHFQVSSLIEDDKFDIEWDKTKYPVGVTEWTK